jgi:ABC-type polar amino acid transport system ATPase subunit
LSHVCDGVFRKIADRVAFMDQGQIIEENAQTKLS